MATSKLQRLFGDMLDRRLSQYRIRENYRSDWLISSDNTWLELDFYIEELNVAFEVQGAQHFQFVPFFHKSEEDFKKRRKHDNEKRTLCYGRGIKLIEICTETDAEIAIRNIEEKIKKDQPKYLYHDDQLSKRKMKKYNKNNVNEVARRLKKCMENLILYEQGLIVVDFEKVLYWKRVIENEGKENGRDLITKTIARRADL